MRTINLWFDVKHGLLRTAAGTALRAAEYPWIAYRERVTVNLRLVTNETMAPYVLTGVGETYSVALDDDFDHDTSVMCGVTHASITATLASGLFVFTLNANNANFRSAIGIDEELTNTHLEFQAWAGGTLILDCVMPFYARNVVDDSGGAEVPAFASALVGSVAIDSGASVVTVSGQAWASVPATVLVSVRKPNTGGGVGEYNLFATVRTDTITAAGFTADLSAATDVAGYKLDYVVAL
jgi:hypothetical protein